MKLVLGGDGDSRWFHDNELCARQTVGRYELLAKRGAGGMAEVWLARTRRRGGTGVERLVAMKIAHRLIANDLECRALFRFETEVGASIHHANVVGAIDAGEVAGRPYLVMPLVDGVCLTELRALGREPLPVGVVSSLLCDTLRGLHAAHDARDGNDRPYELVHCDVSPGNILVGFDGVARISDFGAAARVSARTERRSALRGSMAYLSPEQARGAAVDRRSDVFAAGTVLWECLTGARLFRGETREQTIANVLAARVLHPSEVRPSIPSALGDVAMRALEGNPRDRFPTALDMARALASAARDSDVVAEANAVASFVEEHASHARASLRSIPRCAD